jgi:tetratricopeptide (TPR) repeat protein
MSLTSIDWRLFTGTSFIALVSFLISPHCMAQPEWLISDGGMYVFDQSSWAKNRSDAKGAINNFTTKLTKNPNDLDALRGRAEAYMLRAEYGKAVSDFSRMIKIDPQDASFYGLRAAAFYQLHHYKKSIADHTKEITLSPECYECYIHRATVELAAGMTKAAIADCTKSIEIKPTNEGFTTRASIYRKLGLKQEEGEDTRRAMQSTP